MKKFSYKAMESTAGTKGPFMVVDEEDTVRAEGVASMDEAEFLAEALNGYYNRILLPPLPSGPGVKRHYTYRVLVEQFVCLVSDDPNGPIHTDFKVFIQSLIEDLHSQLQTICESYDPKRVFDEIELMIDE